MRRLLVCLLQVWLLFVASAHAAVEKPAVRISAWYWLNAAPKETWASDFKKMHQIGFTDVMLVWGLDAAGFAVRIQDSHQAIEEAHKARLGSYLFVWHARHNSLEHLPQFEQVDSAGHHLFAFDVFNPEWRHGPWKTYLEKLAREYGPEPGLSGYIFDNSFAIGRISKIDGPAPKDSESYISYGPIETRMFGSTPPTDTSAANWKQWTAAREKWWADWASDTARFIRAIDKNPHHEVFLEDGANAIDPDTISRAGVDLTQVTDHFDTMGAYFAPSYSAAGEDQKLGREVTAHLGAMRAAIGPKKKLVLSLRLSEGDKENGPEPAAFPTLEQIKILTDAALAAGASQIDMYGFRMGIYHLDETSWNEYRPAAGSTYKLTGEVRNTFLCDRPTLTAGLTKYFRTIKSR